MHISFLSQISDISVSSLAEFHVLKVYLHSQLSLFYLKKGGGEKTIQTQLEEDKIQYITNYTTQSFSYHTDNEKEQLKDNNRCTNKFFGPCGVKDYITFLNRGHSVGFLPASLFVQ